MQQDIFISYRRDGGDMVSHILYERLTQMGYTVFLDIESLRSGKFNEAIYEKIEQCKDFLLVLPAGSLDRCKDEDDWVRREIECAMRYHKNIIPVMLRGFEWPDDLPESLKDLRLFNGMTASTEYFDMFLVKLTEFFTTPKPHTGKKSVASKHLIRNILGGVILVGLLLSPIIAIYGFNVTFTLPYRILYFIVVLAVAKLLLYEIETRPAIAKSCFGTIKETTLQNTPDVVFSRVAGAFSKDILISTEENTVFTRLFVLRRMFLGTWDEIRTNYVRVLFRRRAEWYDPSIFYLHSLSRIGDGVKMLTRQGFVVQTTPNWMDPRIDYLIKDDFHVFLHYKKKWLDYVEVFQCSAEDIKDRYNMIQEEVSKHEKISLR